LEWSVIPLPRQRRTAILDRRCDDAAGEVEPGKIVGRVKELQLASNLEATRQHDARISEAEAVAIKSLRQVFADDNAAPQHGSYALSTAIREALRCAPALIGIGSDTIFRMPSRRALPGISIPVMRSR
jgi:hypothetical protein